VADQYPKLQEHHWLTFLGEAFRTAGLEHALIGAHAVIAWSLPRATADFDFIVAASRDSIATLRAALESQGLRIHRLQNPSASSGPDFVQLKTADQLLQVDLQTAKTEFQDLIIARAVADERYGISVASPEDIVVLKLLAMRGKDQRDIHVLIEARGDTLDWAYIEHWAEVWDVVKELRIFRPKAE
jgi:hypothetical protein